ncbi:MAG: hypothetical protein LHW48_09975 [Candidatus Cloacimonetes bacterium]|nr:hypothetical protein [Candidatus Cloacimonadota bacterium]
MMHHDSYLSTAKRHLHVCQLMLSNWVPSNSSENYKSSVIYYLSGYIFEGIVNYAVCSIVNWTGKSVYQLDTPLVVFKKRSYSDNRLELHRHKYSETIELIYTHNPQLETKVNNLFVKYGSKRLFNSWSSSYRYKKFDQWNNINDVVNYLNFCSDFYVLVRNSI